MSDRSRKRNPLTHAAVTLLFFAALVVNSGSWSPPDAAVNVWNAFAAWKVIPPSAGGAFVTREVSAAALAVEPAEAESVEDETTEAESAEAEAAEVEVAELPAPPRYRTPELPEITFSPVRIPGEEPVESEPESEPESFIFQGEVLQVSPKVAPLQIQPGDFIRDGDRFSYVGDQYDVAFGIDVSAHHNDDYSNHTLDWEAAKASGVEFVFVRIAFRGTSEGSLFEDAFYTQNIEGAMAAGLQTGVYIYSQAISVEEAQEEADFVIELLEGLPIDAPVCYDWEIANSSSRNYRVKPETATACALAFCQRIAAEGYTPIIYGSKEVSYLKYDQEALAPYLYWYPLYPAKSDSTPCPDYQYHIDIWQFSDRCSIPGIGKRVDGNLWIREKADAA